ncbi:MAG: ABC transporter ATP-binding protein [Planctomycetota bacterium]
MLEVRALVAGYADGPDVLKDITAQLSAGVSVVIGPNGAGKSTLLRALLGVLAPRSGDVLLDGQQLTRLRARVRARRIAYLPQRPMLSAAFTVEQVVALGRHAWGPDGPSVRRSLERVGMMDRFSDTFASLSVGQQQRVSLARALAQLDGAGSSVLLADEPFSAMDPKHTMQSASILQQLASDGVTVVVVVHDFTLARRIGDRALLLDMRGRLAAEGPAAEVLEPARLSEVFGVGFDACDVPGGPALIPVQHGVEAGG